MERPPSLCRAIAFAIVALMSCSPALRAQSAPDARAADSTARRCMDISWIAPETACAGRLGNAASLAVLGAAAGALDGVVGGWIVSTACIGDAEKAAVRGAIAGATAGLLTGLLVPHITRREQGAREARERERAAANPIRPWSWRDVKPVFVVGGVATVMGAGIGAIQGSRRDDRCGGGAWGGAARGAAVYGSGVFATVGIALVGVRFLF